MRRGAGRADGDGFALEVGKALDVVAHGQAVCAVGAVHQEDLRDGHAIDCPGNVRLHRRGRALDGAGSQRQMAVFLRNHLDFGLDAVLFEQPGFLGQRERPVARPARNAHDHLGGLLCCRTCRAGHGRNDLDECLGQVCLLLICESRKNLPPGQAGGSVGNGGGPSHAAGAPGVFRCPPAALLFAPGSSAGRARRS